MQESALAAMKESPIFCGLRDEDLMELIIAGSQRVEEPGTTIIQEGARGESLFVILSGEVEVLRDAGDSETTLARFGPGAFVGEMALVDEGPRTASVRTIEQSNVLEITRAQFDRLIDESPDAGRALVRTILRRLKSTEAMLVNQEKLAGLGRLSAGLAHELNNPASAVGRFTEQLVGTFEQWQQSSIELIESEHPIQLSGLLLNGASSGGNGMSSLELADAEDHLAEWLENHKIDQFWDVASNLAASGWTVSDLEKLEREIAPDDIAPVINWLSAESGIRVILAEIRTSAQRLSQIVSSVKSYSHMDRAAREPTDVNQGLESTMVILRYKTRNLQVSMDLDPELPLLDGYPGELNQVWTNLVDNAVDAMGGDGTLEIRTFSDRSCVVVTISDSGSGITDEHRRRLFEPFFTTKDVGQGTGLGLHISHNIVVHRHGGRIDVESRPGKTTFTVSLPIQRNQ
ncbi:MAG: ATP-binding protein [Thermomicrobiaceae bacterium]